jgi:hypothetical protein
MRRTAMIMILLISAVFGYSQKSVDRLFEKYSGSDGFVTLTINGDILKILRACDQNERQSCLPAKITEIRILAQDNEEMGVDNFYKNVMKELDRNDYDEFMRVKESHQDMIMLVKSEGRRFREFLLVAGGDDDNVIVQVKGDMTLNEAHKFSGEMKKDCCTGFISAKK